MRTFEEYLTDKFFAQYTGLDDEAPEAKQDWIAELEPYDWIDYVGQWVKEEYEKKCDQEIHPGNPFSPHKNYNQCEHKWEIIHGVREKAFQRCLICGCEKEEK